MIRHGRYLGVEVTELGGLQDWGRALVRSIDRRPGFRALVKDLEVNGRTDQTHGRLVRIGHLLITQYTGNVYVRRATTIEGAREVMARHRAIGGGS